LLQWRVLRGTIHRAGWAGLPVMLAR
jgi:hypothetical protein